MRRHTSGLAEGAGPLRHQWCPGQLEAGGVHTEHRNRKDVCMSAFQLSNYVRLGGGSLYIEARPMTSQIEREPHQSTETSGYSNTVSKHSKLFMTISTNI